MIKNVCLLILILCWTQEYKDILNSLDEFEAPRIAQFERKIKPPYDMLFEKVSDKSRESALLLHTAIKYAGLDAIDVDFLTLQLNWIGR